MIVTGVTDELEAGIKIRSEVFSDVYDVQSEVGRCVCFKRHYDYIYQRDNGRRHGHLKMTGVLQRVCPSQLHFA